MSVLGGPWQWVWRWLGLVLIPAGVAQAQDRQGPDLFVGLDRRLVAQRQADGILAINRSRCGKLELEQWLARDGDPGFVAQILKRAGFKYDCSRCISKLDK